MTSRETTGQPDASPAPLAIAATKSSRRVLLRPFLVEDLPLLYFLSLDPQIGPRFRWGGATPRPEEVADHAWDGVLCQFTVCRRRDSAPIGIATISAANLTHGYATGSIVVRPDAHGTGEGLEAYALLLDYAFNTWPLRKIYHDVLDESLAQFERAVRRYAVVEGCKRQHQYVNGRYQDLYTLAVYRDPWLGPDRLLERFGVRARPPSMAG